MRISVAAVIGVLILLAPPASAQVAWESPYLLSPQTPDGFGILLIDPAPGDGIGVLGMWRANPTMQRGLGFRVGVAEDHGDGVAGFGGVDLTGPLVRSSGDFPADIIWTLGAGLGIGEDVLVSVPVGLSLGASFDADGVVFSPYVGPRMILDGVLGNDGPGNGSRGGDDLNINFAVDLGMDIAFSPDWIVRFGWSAGDHEALGIGLMFQGLR